MTKYILVSGGVISGVGKGVISSSIGMLLKAQGLRVTSIKVDPYLNIDAGTFSPYEHGEVYVLDDGGECDLDLGNYERFLDITLTRDSNITTGKIYKHVMDGERRGSYLGKTVQVVPHITNAIQDWVERVAKLPTDGSDIPPDVCIIELGGTVGDIESMPFVEAFRQFQFRVGDGPGNPSFLSVHVSLVPETTDHEQKTKPTQHSIRELRGLGISPDIVICRSKNELGEKVKSKLAMFCHVTPSRVVSVHDCSSIYRVPLLLESQNLLHILKERLQLDKLVLPGEGEPRVEDEDYAGPLAEWKSLADRYESLTKTVKIVLVGKYTELSDAYASVIKALRHSCVQCNRKLELLYVEAHDLEATTLETDPERYHKAWGRLVTGAGVLVPGGFGTRGLEGKIAAVHWARTKKVPFLGICLGFQMAVIEYARNVLGWEGAHTTEAVPDTPHPVIIDMPEISQTIMGGTQRLGKRRTVFNRECVTKKLYGNVDSVDERHRHRYEVNPKNVAAFEERGLQFVGKDHEGERMEILELDEHPYFCAAQFHPEFLSRPLKPHPMFYGFILASCGKLASFLKRAPGSSAIQDIRPSSPLVSPERSTKSPSKSPDFSAFEKVPSPLKFSATAEHGERKTKV